MLPSSTNPTLPYTVNSVDELLDMVMVCHHLSHDIPEDVAFADSRVRAETISAETVLHDLGIISIFSSDSQAMGRIGESVTRAFQTAHHCKDQRGKLPEDADGNDNFRVLRYLAKLTINPAIAQGIADHVGSIEPGKMADIVLWPIDSFAAKPKMVIKGGIVNWALMGDPNASLPTPQPVYYRPMFGAHGQGPADDAGDVHVARPRSTSGVPGAARPAAARSCRSGARGSIGKKDMVRNDATPVIEVDPETYRVTVDGVAGAHRAGPVAAADPAVLPRVSATVATTDLGQLLVSLQLSDSAFPSGLYTMSHGLEGFHQARLDRRRRRRRAARRSARSRPSGPATPTALARAHEAADGGRLDGGRSTSTACCSPPSSTPRCAPRRCAAAAS